MIVNRDGQLIVRPDSGDPPVIVPQLLDLLGKAFEEGVTTTPTGHKMLPPQVRIIQGDGPRSAGGTCGKASWRF